MSRLLPLQSLSTQPRLHSYYLIFPDIAVPLAAISIAARLELPGSLVLRCSDRLRDRCKVDPAVPELPKTRPEFDQTACVGPKLPSIGSTETDFSPPERTRLHQNGLASKALIYLQITSHLPLRNVFAFLQKVFPSSTSEKIHTPVQRLTFAQPIPTRRPLPWTPYYPTPNP